MSAFLGLGEADVLTSSDTPQFAVGTRGVVNDANGTREFLYVTAAEAITAAGYMCVVDTAFSAQMVDTTSSAPGAGAGMICGAAQAAIASGGYGWLQVYGKGSLRTLASAALGTQLTSSATPGALDDATTAGLEVIEGVALGTATGGAEATNTDAYFNYPYVGRTL